MKYFLTHTNDDAGETMFCLVEIETDTVEACLDAMKSLHERGIHVSNMDVKAEVVPFTVPKCHVEHDVHEVDSCPCDLENDIETLLDLATDEITEITFETFTTLRSRVHRARCAVTEIQIGRLQVQPIVLLKHDDKITYFPSIDMRDLKS